MVRSVVFAAFFTLLFASPAVAQEDAWQFRWKKGQELKYRVQHETMVVSAVGDAKVETISKLTVVKKWKVADVDAKGVATLELSLISMRNEQRRPNGDKLLFDSEDPEQSTPELVTQMKKYIGTTVAELRLNRQGQVVEVKKGSVAKYEAEPPFSLVLPAISLSAGKGWVRPYKVTLEPPLGTGEKIAAKQKFVVGKVADGKASITVSTEFPEMPMEKRDQIPLLQKDVQGEVVFDVAAGRLQSVQLNVDRTLENVEGANSSYRFQSTYREEFLGVK